MKQGFIHQSKGCRNVLPKVPADGIDLVYSKYNECSFIQITFETEQDWGGGEGGIGEEGVVTQLFGLFSSTLLVIHVHVYRNAHQYSPVITDA